MFSKIQLSIQNHTKVFMSCWLMTTVLLKFNDGLFDIP